MTEKLSSLAPNVGAAWPTTAATGQDRTGVCVCVCVCVNVMEMVLYSGKVSWGKIL